MVEPTGNCTQDPAFYDPVIVTIQKIIWEGRKDLPMDGCDTQQSVAARWGPEGQDTSQVWFKVELGEKKSPIRG